MFHGCWPCLCWCPVATAAGSPGTLSWMSRVWTVASWSQALLLSPPPSHRFLACLLACFFVCLLVYLLADTQTRIALQSVLARMHARICLVLVAQSVSGRAEGPPLGREGKARLVFGESQPPCWPGSRQSCSNPHHECAESGAKDCLMFPRSTTATESKEALSFCP